MAKVSQRLFATAIMCGDFVLTGAAFGVAYYIRFYSGIIPIIYVPAARDSMILLALALPLALISLTFFGAYETRRTESAFSDIPAIFNSSIILVLVLSAFTYFYKDINFSRLTFILLGGTFFTLFSIERILLRLLARYLLSLGFNNKKLLIVGAGSLGRRVLRTIQKNTSYGYKIVGFLDDYISNGYFKKDYGFDVLGRTREIVQVFEKYEIDKVIIALPIRAYDKISRIIDRCDRAGIETELVPDFFRIISPKAGIRNLGGLPILGVNSLPFKSWTYDFFKRSFDIIFSVMLLILFSPLMTILALLVKITSRGPIFFTQERIGVNKKCFKMIKFRTMFQNAEELLQRKLSENDELRYEWETNFKLKSDPRITPIGAFLRKTSLDELPQLFNVLRGEMSLVGPRPLPFYHQKELSKQLNMIRGRVRPGMTGLWQISGRNEAGTKGMELWDLYYIRNWSVWLDFVILLRTVPVVFKGTGAC